mgnify:CR=1 FL=1
MLASNDKELLNKYFKEGHYNNKYLTIRSVKAFIDGALGSRGAALHQPYDDDLNNCGLILITTDRFNQLAQDCYKYNFQLKVDFLVVTNGIKHYCCQMDYEKNEISFLDDIPAFLESVRNNWLQIDGIFAFGIDHYQENEACHGWSEKVGARMAMFSESEWRDMVEVAGFEILRMFRAAPSEEWVGTLAIVARNGS